MKAHTMLLLALWFVIILIAIIGLSYLTFCTSDTCYAQVDNARLTEIIPRGGMYYRYELPAFDEKGKERTVSFETNRVLRDDAYLRLNVAPIRGVTSWEEVTPEDIPDRAWNMLGLTE